MGTEAECHGEHDAAGREDRDRVGSRGWSLREVRVEGVAVGGAVGRDVLRNDLRGKGVAGDVVFVEDVVEAETELGVVEVAAGAQRVIDEDVG